MAQGSLVSQVKTEAEAAITSPPAPSEIFTKLKLKLNLYFLTTPIQADAANPSAISPRISSLLRDSEAANVAGRTVSRSIFSTTASTTTTISGNFITSKTAAIII